MKFIYSTHYSHEKVIIVKSDPGSLSKRPNGEGTEEMQVVNVEQRT